MEVDALSQKGDAAPPCYGDEAVDETSGCDAVRRHGRCMRAAASKSVVGSIAANSNRRSNRCRSFSCVRARAGKDLHDYRFRYCQRAAMSDQIDQTPIYCASRGSVVRGWKVRSGDSESLNPDSIDVSE